MSSTAVEVGVGQVQTGLDNLAATDLLTVDDTTLRQQLLALATIANRVHAEIGRHVDVFDRRGLAQADGFRTSKAWLIGWCRWPGALAARVVKTARLLRGWPRLAAAALAGEVSPERLRPVVRLAEQVGADRLGEVEASLADAAAALDPAGLELVCERVRAWLEPDGPDPAEAFARRGVTLSPVAGMHALRGQLDPEGGAALSAALDALMTPPGEGDDRTAAQRRADALVDLARRQLAGGIFLPWVGSAHRSGCCCIRRHSTRSCRPGPGWTRPGWTRPGCGRRS